MLSITTMEPGLIHLDFHPTSQNLSATLRILPFPISPNLFNHFDYFHQNLVCMEIKVFQNILLTFSNFVVVIVVIYGQFFYKFSYHNCKPESEQKTQARMHRKEKDTPSAVKSQPMIPVIQHFEHQSYYHPLVIQASPKIMTCCYICNLVLRKNMVTQLLDSQTCPTRVYSMTFLNQSQFQTHCSLETT